MNSIKDSDIDFAFLNDKQEAVKLAKSINKKVYKTGSKPNAQYFVGSAWQAFLRLNLLNVLCRKVKRIY